ncbi:alpha/beta fold hydrolase [Actinomadura syzygii]|nr:alpha/beta hydrolase [Actinomadura syzygii]
MRKILVCGAAFAATCVAAVAVPGGAEATPTPSPPAASIAPSEETSASPSPPPGVESPSTWTETPPQGRTPRDGEPDATVSAEAVMVTPRLPRARSYAYGKDPNQRIDAYWRKEGPKAKPRPVVLILHGGYWMQGDKGSWKYFARRLTEDGFVVMSANYRLAPKAQWPAQRDDALSALAFVKKYARHWNADPSRVVVLGASSGGQLATQVGTFGTGGAQVRGVIALSPPNDPYLAYQDGALAGATPSQRKLRRAVVDLVHCVPGAVTGLLAAPDCWQRLDDANTTTHVSAGDAPMLLMHATGDFVPVAQSNGLAGALREAGVPVTVKTVEGKMHASQLFEDEHTYPTVLAWLKNRLRPGR